MNSHAISVKTLTNHVFYGIIRTYIREGVYLVELVFKFKPKLDSLQSAILEELSFHTTKLYNTANYDCITNGFRKYVDMEKLHKSNWHGEYLHSHNYQHCLKLLEQNWKSYKG